MLSLIDILLSVLFLFIIIYFGFRYHFDYWKRKGVYSPKASIPAGHIGDVLLGKEQIGVKVAKIYEEYKDRPYVGLFLLHSKVLIVNDLDLIKTILVKEFQSFNSHGMGISPETDPLSNNISNMDGAEWKKVRLKLTPAFSAIKMKYMFESILDCSRDMSNYLEEQVALGNTIDFKDTFAKYTIDAVSSCAFGICASSFKHPNAEFRQLGRRIFDTSFFKSAKDILSFLAPSIIRRFKLRLIYRDVEDFLIKSISETIKYREENNVTRNDFLQILIDMKKEDEKNGDAFKLIEIVAEVYIFFSAGFETSSLAATYTLYELAKNPNIQEKLIETIDEIGSKYDGKITYESLGEMTYLTQIIEETLRIYPPVPFLPRCATKDYTLPDTNITIEKDTIVFIPLLGFQRDPNIHDSPMEFRPERFSPENKKSNNQFTSIPFGEGPRNCIGGRFGMMQSKLGIVSILSKYHVSLCEDTPILIEFNPGSISLSPKGNLNLKLTKRM